MPNEKKGWRASLLALMVTAITVGGIAPAIAAPPGVSGNIGLAWDRPGVGVNLGNPTTGEIVTNDGVGRVQLFEQNRGRIYWRFNVDNSNAHAVWGAIVDRLASVGWEDVTGFPVTDELPTPDGQGRFNHFAGAPAHGPSSIYWSPATGAHPVWGLFRERWAAAGWEGGTWGYPTSGEYVSAGVTVQDFTKGQARLINGVSFVPTPPPTTTPPPTNPTPPPATQTATTATLNLTPTDKAVKLDWALQVGTDGANGSILSRTPEDWASPVQTGTSGSLDMLYLNNDTTYTFKVQPTKDGVPVGTAVTKTGKPGGATTTPPPAEPTQPPVTPPTTPPTQPPAPTGDVGKATLAGLQLPAPGFFSGGSGQELAEFRGQETTFTTTWQDIVDGGAWGWGPTLDTVRVPKLLNIATGGPSDWAAAARGSQDAAWGQYLRDLRAARTINGVLYPTILTPAHEMNACCWYGWQVDRNELVDYRTTMTNWEAIADREFPEAMFAQAFNGDSNAGIPARDYAVPGVFDAIDVHLYNQYPYIGTARNGTTVTWEDGANRGTIDNPRGIIEWSGFAGSLGVPWFMGEWGNNGDAQGSEQSGDDPTFTREMYAYMNATAGKGAGQALAEAWFNHDTEHHGWHLTGPGVEAPAVARFYADAFPMQ